jgi:hypothetical protein
VALERQERPLDQTEPSEEGTVPVRSMDCKSKGRYQQHEIDGANATNRARTSQELSEPHRVGWQEESDDPVRDLPAAWRGLQLGPTHEAMAT